MPHLFLRFTLAVVRPIWSNLRIPVLLESYHKWSKLGQTRRSGFERHQYHVFGKKDSRWGIMKKEKVAYWAFKVWYLLITLLSIIFSNIVVLKGKSCFGSSNVCNVEKTCQEPLSSDGKPAKSKWNKSSVKSKSGKTSKSDSSKGPVFIGPSLPPHQIEESLPYLKVYILKFW